MLNRFSSNTKKLNRALSKVNFNNLNDPSITGSINNIIADGIQPAAKFEAKSKANPGLTKNIVSTNILKDFSKDITEYGARYIKRQSTSLVKTSIGRGESVLNKIIVFNTKLDYGTESIGPENFEVLIDGLHVPGIFTVSQINLNIEINLTQRWVIDDRVLPSDVYVFGKLIKLGDALFDFTEHTFTNAGVTGSIGPTINQLRTVYSASNWAQEEVFLMQGEYQGYQKFVIPKTTKYRFEVVGAGGGMQGYWYTNGNIGTNRPIGAKIICDLDLTEGDELQIIVGQRGEDTNPLYWNDNGEGRHAGPGGGGASWVFFNSNNEQPLIVAGGGAGGSKNVYQSANANTVSFGFNSQRSINGGLNGNGARTNIGGVSYWAGGGAGWLTDGTGGNNPINYNYLAGTEGADAGRSPKNGLIGGVRYFDFGLDSGGDGGFGGGGGGGSDSIGTGGGGGYSGGGGANSDLINGAGGGGGTYYTASASNVTASFANSWEHGYIKITKL